MPRHHLLAATFGAACRHCHSGPEGRSTQRSHGATRSATLFGTVLLSLLLPLTIALGGCSNHPKLQMSEIATPPGQYVFLRNEAHLSYAPDKVPINDEFAYSPQQYLDDRLHSVLDPQTDARALLVWDYSIIWWKPLPAGTPIAYQYGAIGAAINAIAEEIKKNQEQVEVDTFRCEFRGKYREKWFEVTVQEPLCPSNWPRCATQRLNDSLLQLDSPALREDIQRHSQQCLDQIVAKVREIKTTGLQAQPDQP